VRLLCVIEMFVGDGATMEEAMDKQDKLPWIATVLGRAGLLPFCAAPLLMYLDPRHQLFYADMLASYALAIICFLVGAWWGLALIRRSPMALVMSNAVVIVAFLGHALLSTGMFFLLCAVLYPATVIVERRAWLFQPQPPYYARLRAQLTVVASAALLLAAVLPR
jgi:hypothetical protein